MSEKCVECGKIAVVPPLCLGCMLNMTDEQYRLQELSYAIKAGMFDDERGQLAHECSMCGKECASVDKNGHCSSCRQVWNS